MRLKLFALTVLLLSFLVSCNGARTIPTSKARIDLTERLSFAETTPDTQILIFGTPEGRKSLLSGWSSPEKEHGVPFQWADSKMASLAFRLDTIRPSYLHVKMRSFYINAADVYINSRLVGHITIKPEPQVSLIPLPEEALLQGNNVIEFRFSEIRTPEGNRDIRQLAAAAYYAVITPSKYAAPLKGNHSTGRFWLNERIRIGNKRLPALICERGGSFRFYEKLNRNSEMQFGYRFHPHLSFPENDDFAAFSVFLRGNDGQEKRIFHKRLTEETLESVHLTSFVPEERSTFYEIEFRLERNSIFNNALTAWLEPVLIHNDSGGPDSSASNAQLAELREKNYGANVVLIVLDAASSGHFGCYGYPRNTTPVTDTLAAQGIRFNRTYTQAVYTLASTASLMTGLYPIHHRTIGMRNRLPAEVHTLAETFRAGNYATGTFVANGNASTIFGMTQGFQEIGEVFRDADYTGWGQDITDRFTGWLTKRSRRRPFFAYLHYREPHAPFNPPPGWIEKFVDPSYKGIKEASYEIRRKINMGELAATGEDRNYIVSLYDANLAYGDFQVGLVVQKLKELGIYDRTIVIVTADHGEAFWEHGFQGHNSQLYEESIRIPLVIKPAKDSVIAPLEVGEPVRTIDMYPTLVDLLSLSRKGIKPGGSSFLPYLLSGSNDGREILVQTIGQRDYAYLSGDYKYIVTLVSRREELYNLKDDPLEQHNLVEKESKTLAYFRSRFYAWWNANRNVNIVQRTENAVIDESARENLKALGYIEE